MSPESKVRDRFDCFVGFDCLEMFYPILLNKFPGSKVRTCVSRARRDRAQEEKRVVACSVQNVCNGGE